jgi:branched-chain amino acid transport system ATP-binding protein
MNALSNPISAGSIPLLELQAVRAGYGAVEVLHEVSLQIGAGEFVALVGSNNAGKSTLLLTVSGLIKPRGGVIRLAGENIGLLAPHEIVGRGIVQVPERKRLFPHMTVLDNLLIGGSNFRARSARLATLAQMCETFPVLAARRDQRAMTLSGGEQQILAIARGLMAQPKLLILDEPSLGLAPLMVQEIYDVLARLNKEGLTILLSEQNARMSLQLSQRAYVLQEGRIAMSGDSRSLLASDEVRRTYLGL